MVVTAASPLLIPVIIVTEPINFPDLPVELKDRIIEAYVDQIRAIYDEDMSEWHCVHYTTDAPPDDSKNEYLRAIDTAATISNTFRRGVARALVDHLICDRRWCWFLEIERDHYLKRDPDSRGHVTQGAEQSVYYAKQFAEKVEKRIVRWGAPALFDTWKAHEEEEEREYKRPLPPCIAPQEGVTRLITW